MDAIELELRCATTNVTYHDDNTRIPRDQARPRRAPRATLPASHAAREPRCPHCVCTQHVQATHSIFTPPPRAQIVVVRVVPPNMAKTEHQLVSKAPTKEALELKKAEPSINVRLVMEREKAEKYRKEQAEAAADKSSMYQTAVSQAIAPPSLRRRRARIPPPCAPSGPR